MKNTITWFEINVANLERSIKFYNHVLETEIRVMELDGFHAMGIFPDEGVNGALVEEEGYEAPEYSGIMLYFDGNVLAFFNPLNKNVLSTSQTIGGQASSMTVC